MKMKSSGFSSAGYIINQKNKSLLLNTEKDKDRDRERSTMTSSTVS